MRYPLQEDKILRAILTWEEADIEPVDKDQYIYVFMLRDRIEHTELEAETLALISAQFDILNKILIPRSHREALKKRIRGGNWYDKEYDRETWPYLFVITEDKNPQPLAEPDKKYPLIDNKSFYKKLHIRDAIAEKAGSGSNCIHGTDNLGEAAYVLTLLRKAGFYDP